MKCFRQIHDESIAILGYRQRTVVPIVNPKISCFAGSTPDCFKTPFTANSIPVVTSAVVGCLKDAMTPLVDGSLLRVISIITPSVLVPKETNGPFHVKSLQKYRETRNITETHLLHRHQFGTCSQRISSIWIKLIESTHDKDPSTRCHLIF